MVFFFKTENSNRVIAERQLSREITAFHPASLLFRRSNFLVTIIKRVYFHLKCHLARTELCLSPSCITFSLKVLAKLLPSLSLTLVYLGLTLPSLFVAIYCLNQILCLISPCCQSCILFFAMPSSIKFFLYCGLIITNIHASSALGDTGLICPSAWGSFFFWKGLDLQWNFIWAGEAVPEHFLVLLILHVSPANGSVSRVTFSGLAESFECTPALLCTKGSHISRAFLTLAL